MSRRMERVNVLVRQEISRILATDINDPRLASLISITEVQTSSDLRQAKVFVSVLGDSAAKKDALTAMRTAGGFIHRTMKRNMKLKYVPVLSFQLDESIEKGAEMLKLIDRNAPSSLTQEDTDATEA